MFSSFHTSAETLRYLVNRNLNQLQAAMCMDSLRDISTALLYLFYCFKTLFK